MENRIKESQADLFADRTSTATMRANQLRLWLASLAHVLLCTLRRIGLRFTQFANATWGTIRLKLLKIGARVTVSVRSPCHPTIRGAANGNLPTIISEPPQRFDETAPIIEKSPVLDNRSDQTAV